MPLFTKDDPSNNIYIRYLKKEKEEELKT